MIIGSTGRVSETYLMPMFMNKVLGTKFKIVSGYKGMAQTLLAMEREEIHGMGNWSFSDIETGRPDWITEKKVRILLQLGLTKSESPLLRDVPLVLDVARNDVRMPKDAGYRRASNRRFDCVHSSRWDG